MEDVNITIEAGKSKRLKVAGTLPRRNIVVTSKDNHLPIEVTTEAQMDALPIGAVFRYVGESGTYENGALYVVEESG